MGASLTIELCIRIAQFPRLCKNSGIYMSLVRTISDFNKTPWSVRTISIYLMFLSSADFFQNCLFKKILSGIVIP